MQLQMTENDKKLITFLAVFVIVVAGGYWGIYPVIKNIISYKEEIEDAETTQQMNELKIAQVTLLEVENQEIEEEMSALKATFFPQMSSDQVDKYITGLMLSYNLNAYDLSISMSDTEASVEPYQYSVKAAEEEEEDDSSSDSDAEDSDEENTDWFSDYDDVSTGIYAVGITMRVGGAQEDLDRLIDDLSVTNQKLHLVSYSWSEQRSMASSEDGTYEIELQKTLTVKMNLYMCEDAE